MRWDAMGSEREDESSVALNAKDEWGREEGGQLDTPSAAFPSSLGDEGLVRTRSPFLLRSRCQYVV